MALIKLTDHETKKNILIGSLNIIDAKRVISANESYTKIRSVGGMVITNYVLETVEEIYELCNKK
jgi:hypothetical protein